MNNPQKIKESYQSAKNYPDLALRLSRIDVESYTVDTATGTVLYRFSNGENVLSDGNAL